MEQRGNQKRISKKDRQHNGQKKKGQKDKQWSSKHTHKTKDRATRTPLKPGLYVWNHELPTK
jgi:hypothetical protein